MERHSLLTLPSHSQRERNMKKIILAAAIMIGLVAVMNACKKDTYNYTCKCVDPTGSLADTFISYNLPTSGHAYLACKTFSDTSTKYGRPYECELTK